MATARTADVALVSMPWNIEQYTSLQIASLKAYLVKQGVSATSRHYHKDLVDFLGVDEREHVHEYGYGEHLFGALYYPERRREFVTEITSRLPTPEIEPILDRLTVFCDAIVADLLAINPKLVGFTTTHVQTMSSIYIARRLKEQRPDIKVVFGGLALFRDFSERLLQLFPEIDFIVNGEGEIALHRLAAAVCESDVTAASVLDSIGGLSRRDETGEIITAAKQAELASLDSLPAPDLADYLDIHLSDDREEIPYPKVCVESARACSWGKCTFCIESIPSRGPYRAKSAGAVVDQIEQLVGAARSTEIAFTDPDMSSRADVFHELIDRGLDLHVLAEVSGMVDLPTLVVMKRAGLSTLQIGVESFSSELLKRFLKGVQLIHYVELMRWCKHLGLTLVYNIIVGAPFETQEAVDEAVANMRLLFSFAPPVISEFVVSLGSPIFQDLDSYGIESLSPLPETACYPESIREGVGPLLSFHAGYAFKTTSRSPRVDHAPLVAAVDEWWKMHNANFTLNAYRGNGFIDLEYKVGTATRRSLVTDPAQVFLLGSVAVEAKSLRQVAVESTDAPSLPQLLAAANELKDRGLLFESDRKVLAIPVFPRIDLGSYNPRRRQRLDLPWIRTRAEMDRDEGGSR